MTEQSLPLEGVLVVSLEQAVAAPVASRKLADAGARVIKLERPSGDFARYYDKSANGQSAYFAWGNVGKESLTVDIKDPDDNALVHRILAKADVFIQNLAVGAAARSGLGSEQLRELYPRLITCDISGYGERGRYAELKAYDLLVQAEIGLISVSGPPGDELGRVGVSIVDISTGVSAALAINEALYERHRTGVGRSIKLSLFDVMADWMSVPLLHHEEKGEGPARIGLAHPTICPYGGFESCDGATIVISVQNDREWEALAGGVLNRPELIEDPDYSDNAARMARREEVDGMVAGFFAQRTRSDLEVLLQEARIAFGVVNSMADVSVHPQLRRIAVDSETGVVAMPAHPDVNRSVKSPRLPQLGEHSDRIRNEFSSSDG